MFKKDGEIAKMEMRLFGCGMDSSLMIMMSRTMVMLLMMTVVMVLMMMMMMRLSACGLGSWCIGSETIACNVVIPLIWELPCLAHQPSCIQKADPDFQFQILTKKIH